MTKYLTRSDLREERFALLCSVVAQPIIVGSVWCQENEVDVHIASAVGKQGQAHGSAYQKLRPSLHLFHIFDNEAPPPKECTTFSNSVTS